MNTFGWTAMPITVVVVIGAAVLVTALTAELWRRGFASWRSVWAPPAATAVLALTPFAVLAATGTLPPLVAYASVAGALSVSGLMLWRRRHAILIGLSRRPQPGRPELVVTRGVQGCGKTTWSKALCDGDRRRWARVNRDEAGAMLHGHGDHGDPAREEKISTGTQPMIEALLRAGWNVVEDGTNLTQESIDIFAAIAARTGATMSIKDMRDMPLDLCIERDAARTGDAHVGKQVITDTHNRLVAKQRLATIKDNG